MEGGPAIQMPMPQNMLESEMIGAIKIKDGLFIGDELASTVSFSSFYLNLVKAMMGPFKFYV